MIIKDKDKSIEFSITGYQFPDEKSTADEYNYDANWLTCNFYYKHGLFSEEYQNSCLLTYELEDLCDAIECILQGEYKEYISNFTENYLNISIKRIGNRFDFSFEYGDWIKSKEWKSIMIYTVINENELASYLEEFKQMKNKYPAR